MAAKVLAAVATLCLVAAAGWWSGADVKSLQGPRSLLMRRRLQAPQQQPASAIQESSSIRLHYLSIDEVEWDYAPGEGNLCSGMPFSEEELVWVEQSNSTVGRNYTKAVYRAYTDGNFTELAPVPPEWQHLGILGPTIYAEEGDTVVVVIRNAARFDFGFHIDGAEEVDPSMYSSPGTAAAKEPGVMSPEGILLGSDVVPSGNVSMSAWKITNQTAPGSGDESSTMYFYHSPVAVPRDHYAGLLGPLIVTRKGEADADGKPTGVDREFVTVFQVLDENASPYSEENLGRLPRGPVIGEELSEEDKATYEEGNLKHTMNGFLFCNTPGLEMVQGERVRWYVAAVGNEVDLHTPHWHGNTGLLSLGSERVDQFNLLPTNLRVMDMVPDAPGTWMYHCHVNDHIKAGMMALYTVTANGTDVLAPGKVREYFIQIEEVLWDYAPAGVNLCRPNTLGTSYYFGRDFNEDELVFVGPGPERVGSVYRKARFIEYTDANFTQPKARAPEEEHLGILGPLLRAEVGDTIRIVLRNKAQFEFSMHPHGVFYLKTSEGNAYNDGSGLNATLHGAVAPGEEYVYEWGVPERAGPGPKDASSAVWLYHSHIRETRDTNAGLVGAIVVTRKGAAKSPEDPTPKDVDREFVAFFSVLDENESIYADNNTVEFALAGDNNETTVAALQASEEYAESNLMHSINGRVYCNLEGFKFAAGERVRWHVVALGTEVDVHSPNWPGHVLVRRGERSSSTILLPATMATLDMLPALQDGTFLFQCHINDHFKAGMMAMLHVLPPVTPLVEQTTPGEVHTHYIAAEPILWDYAPLGAEGNCNGSKFSSFDNAPTFLERGFNRIGGVYRKAYYQEYTNASFAVKTEISPDEGGRGPGQPGEHLGLLGPVLRARVGDTIRVVFRNNLDFPANIDPAGPFAANPRNASDPNAVIGNSVSAPVAPGEEVVYEWPVTKEAGPGADDLSSVLWHYVSSVDMPAQIYAGLLGPIIITDKEMARGPKSQLTNNAPDLMAEDVDREFVTVFGIFNENESPYLQLNRDEFAPGVNETFFGEDAEGFEESNLMHGINWRVYCNVPGMTTAKGERVRFHTLAIGSELDLHTPNFAGELTVTKQGGRRSHSLGLLSGIAQSADTVADSAKSMVYHCGVHDHMDAGMAALYSVE